MIKKEIVLHDRDQNISNKENKMRYEAYKNQLREILLNEMEDRIKIMKIIYEIKENSLYKIDGYKNFNKFLEDFVIARTQAFKYLKIYKEILKGTLNLEELKKEGIKGILRKIKISQQSKENPIKPLRFQLKSQDSYDYYKKNAKFTGFLLDKLFSSEKGLLEKIMNEFKHFKEN
ncbi:chromosome replication/partitioning protein [Borrelia miyamotoi]|uniref:chromosome replication/partitioning protein n=1 Tax=Borrelia miyamotoi TaxID=47466 RepID=UPI000C149DC8|nr:chromosome replication/partitioning protein [Borrelia miyamotoi]ATQ20286.1 chromosome replication/partitioning protein [Borrelia miyamotoi]